jgi:hypothetical protein
VHILCTYFFNSRIVEAFGFEVASEELREDLVVALLVLGAVAVAGLPRQAAFADEHALRRKARLGRQLGVDVIEGGVDFLGLAARLQP